MKCKVLIYWNDVPVIEVEKEFDTEISALMEVREILGKSIERMKGV